MIDELSHQNRVLRSPSVNLFHDFDRHVSVPGSFWLFSCRDMWLVSYTAHFLFCLERFGSKVIKDHGWKNLATATKKTVRHTIQRYKCTTKRKRSCFRLVIQCTYRKVNEDNLLLILHTLYVTVPLFTVKTKNEHTLDILCYFQVRIQVTCYDVWGKDSLS